MNSIKLILRFLFILFFISICSNCTKTQCVYPSRGSINNWIGQNVGPVLTSLNVPLEGFKIIEEPVGVARGIYYQSHSYQIWFYVKKGSLPFSKNSAWKIEDFFEKEIIGVAKSDGFDRWATVGEVIPWFHLKKRDVPKSNP